MKKKNIDFDYNSVPEQVYYESTDITKKSINYLLENNIYKNEPYDNLILIENTIIDYSKSNLEKWGQSNICDIVLDDKISVLKVCEKINEILPEDKKENYFMNYIHYINYICGAMLRQNKEIRLSILKTNIPVTIIEDEDSIDQIILSSDVEIYKLPSEMLKVLKEKYVKEKVLTR